MSIFDYTVFCRNVEMETSSTQCDVQGTVPSWLHGTIMYNGPGSNKFGNCQFKHTFDSSALLQKINIKDGKVFYMTKFLQSDAFKKNRKANAITVPEFGTPATVSRGLFSRLASMMDIEKMSSDNGLLAVVRMGDRFYAIGETPFFNEVNPSTLDVINKVNMNKLYGLVTQTVHIIKDKDGFYYYIGQTVGLTGPKYAVLQFPKNGDVTRGKVVAQIPCRWRMSPCYLHSMAFTENYLIVVETPLAVSIMEMLGDALSNVPFFDAIRWRNENVIFHVIDRRTWQPLATKYVSDSFFFFHFCSVHEEEEQIVINLCSYEDSSFMKMFFIDKLKEISKNISDTDRKAFDAKLTRFVVPICTTSSKEGEELVKMSGTQCSAKKFKNEVHLKGEVLLDLSFENPVVNTAYSDGGNRFTWGLGPAPAGGNYCYLLKFDFETKETKVFEVQDLYVGAPMFVASPNAKSEDDGVLLSIAVTGSDDLLFTLLILDAVSMRQTARATLKIDAAVPLPLHGHFFDQFF